METGWLICCKQQYFMPHFISHKFLLHKSLHWCCFSTEDTEKHLFTTCCLLEAMLFIRLSLTKVGWTRLTPMLSPNVKCNEYETYFQCCFYAKRQIWNGGWFSINTLFISSGVKVKVLFLFLYAFNANFSKPIIFYELDPLP